MIVHSFQKSYHTKTVLSFPEFQFSPGTIYAVIGTNGSGKSTLARILAGILPADRTGALFDLPFRSIGYLPQKPYAFHMSVEKNILLNTKKADAFQKEKASAYMEHLQLTHLRKENAATLSGGETARMALARLLMQDYSFLILDEPCAAMDMQSTLQSEQLLLRYRNEHNCTMLLITHSLKQAQRIADEILFLHNGTLAEYGSAQTCLDHPSSRELSEFLNFFQLY